ncbi:cell cycle control protein Cdc123 [Thermoascus aurantiacus ATCC 26904]
MPHAEPEPAAADQPQPQPQRLPFPPVTYSHILHCSYHYWHPLYRAITPKARLISLNDAFLSYLRADGIVLPPEDNRRALADDDSGIYSWSSDSEDEDEQPDPSTEWREIHNQIKETIAELGGKVTPKLNWSAPKDATFMAATNDLQCRTANDIYLLLKSSDFITHDLEHAFDDCVPDTEAPAESQQQQQQRNEPIHTTPPKIPYHLVLRKYFNVNPSVEFRCFVRNRTLLCMCQRDLNHFDFLFPMRDHLRSKIQDFFDEKLKHTFPDPNFVFDVYIPPPHERVWLMDVNPWAQRTDPLLFSWKEILEMKDPVGVREEEEVDGEETNGLEEDVVRLSINNNGTTPAPPSTSTTTPAQPSEESESPGEVSADGDGERPAPLLPEFRLVARDDPEAYAFNTPQYSAHKLPKEVVDAARAGPGGMKEFMGQWRDILEKRMQEEREMGSDSDEA